MTGSMHGNSLYLKLAAHSGTPPGHSARSRCRQRRLRFDVIHRAMSRCAPHLTSLLKRSVLETTPFPSFLLAVHEPGSGPELRLLRDRTLAPHAVALPPQRRAAGRRCGAV